MLVDVCGTMCTKFCNKRTTFDKITVKTKYTDVPKFADPSMAAVSPYFKRSMLPDHIRRQSTPATFRRHLKTFLFAEVFNTT